MKPYVVAMTGASGVIYGVRLVQALVEAGQKVHLVISESCRLVIREEMDQTLKGSVDRDSLSKLFGEECMPHIEAFQPKDFLSPIASGSFPIAGMVIIPCTMGTLGAIASGISQNLIHRAADCTLKEGRRLVMVPRETPLSAIHLENMLKLTRLGVRMVPAMPGFYSGANSIEDMVSFLVGKVLDQLDVSHALYPRWVGSSKISHNTMRD